MPHNILNDHTRRRPIWVRDDEQAFPRLAKQDAKILKAGGKVLIGSHGQFQGLGYHWEMWSLASGGLSKKEELRAATLYRAPAMGLAHEIGSIHAAKPADLGVLSKNHLYTHHHTYTTPHHTQN